jgi:hypothetical protein
MKDNPIVIDGIEYKWRIHRQPQWCGSDGWKGQAIEVELANEPSRSLIIEFPFVVEHRRSTPYKQRPTPNTNVIATQVHAALNSGWEPSSRGKPFIYAVGQT